MNKAGRLRRLLPVAALLLSGALWLLLYLMTEPTLSERLFGMEPVSRPISLAVLGDSDSHSYQDRITFPEGSSERGGTFRANTLQWTEVLDRARSSTIDQGAWAVWGTRGIIARAQRAVGLTSARIPRKQDFRYNFAISGAVCGDLMSHERGQARFLRVLMDRDPLRWNQGVVVIRLGGNSLSRASVLDKFAQDPEAPGPSATLQQCIGEIEAAVQFIHDRHPRTRVVLVGIFDNSHWARYRDRWHSPEPLRNISRALDRYDQALAAMAAADPRLAFFDDRAWFDQRWGGRDPETGKPAYREVVFGRSLHVTNSLGDAPSNACVADGHSGTVWNALWAQSLVTLLNRRFALGIAPIDDQELEAIVDPDSTLGVR